MPSQWQRSQYVNDRRILVASKVPYLNQIKLEWQSGAKSSRAYGAIWVALNGLFTYPFIYVPCSLSPSILSFFHLFSKQLFSVPFIYAWLSIVVHLSFWTWLSSLWLTALVYRRILNCFVFLECLWVVTIPSLSLSLSESNPSLECLVLVCSRAAIAGI